MTTLRILGDCLDETDVWIDATVETIDLDGTVHLSASTDSRTWTHALEDVQVWKGDDCAVEHASIDVEHAIWDAIATVGEAASDEANSAREYEISQAAKDAFTNAVSAQSR